MGSLTDGLKLAFVRCHPAKNTPSVFPLGWNLQACGALPINVFKCVSADARGKQNKWLDHAPCWMGIWALSWWVMLIVLSSTVGQSVKSHQVGLRSLSRWFPAWICHPAARLHKMSYSVELFPRLPDHFLRRRQERSQATNSSRAA